jgi:hypothetical protein
MGNGEMRGVEQRQCGTGLPPSVHHISTTTDRYGGTERVRDKVGCFHFAPSLFGYFILVLQHIFHYGLIHRSYITTHFNLKGVITKFLIEDGN